jgi:shikimate dehydrogenase
MITGATRIAAVLGHPVAHSKSPQLHNAAFASAGIDAVFVALDVPPAELVATVRALRAAGALGASVTVPHKEAVRAACDQLDAAAHLAGAVNCLVFDGGRVIGANTDVGGFMASLDEAGIAAAGPAVVLGGGGAARAVHAGLMKRTSDVTVVARHPERVSWDDGARPWAELPALLDGAALLVDCTSAGLDGAQDRALADSIPLERLPASAAVATLVYHRRTELLTRAAARGNAILDGAGMLLHQGALAFELWTGRPAPLDVMRAALMTSAP